VPSVLPATGSAIKMGGVYQAYTNTAPSAGLNIRLSATLGASYGGKVAGAQISFSATFGGKTAPYTYS
jgi:hypothetical protein